MAVGDRIAGIILARAGSALVRLADRWGRLGLLCGLFLVALTSLRLPGGVGGAADLALGFAFFCAMVVAVSGRPLPLVVLRTQAIGLALFSTGIAIATVVQAEHTWLSLAAWLKFVFATTGVFLTCLILLHRPEHVRHALGCWVASAAISATFAILQAWLADRDLGYSPNGRMPGLTLKSTELGAITALAMVPALCLLAGARSWLERALWGGAATLCATGPVLSAARIGALIALVTLALWGSLHFRLRRRFTLTVTTAWIVVGVLGVAAYGATGGADLGARLSSAATTDQVDGAVAERLYHYRRTVGEALANPMVGTGLALADAQVWGLQIHNTLLMALRAGGVLALLGLAIILADLLYKAWTTYLRSGPYPIKVLALALGAGVVGLCVNGLTAPLLFQRQVWIPSALMLALKACLPHAGRPSGRAPAPTRATRRGHPAPPPAHRWAGDAPLLVRHTASRR